ncbi:MAG: hypothetical protein ABFD08_02575 [Syntrophomonas sp.]
MSINSQLEALYAGWKKPEEQFISGGVVNEDKYCSAKCKLLVLLKEASDKDNDADWSLVDLVNDQIKAYKAQEKGYLEIWKRIGMYSYGLQNEFENFINISLKIWVNDVHIPEGLEYIAVTNLKKSGGAGSSNYEEIKGYAIRDKELWIKEIKIMNPDVVMCGGTFSIVHEILEFKKDVSPSGAEYGKALGTVFVDFPHPMYQISPKIYYAYFAESMRELKRIGAY